MTTDTATGRLKLATRRDVERKLLNLLDLYRRLYGTALLLGEKTYDPHDLVLTQDYLESDKLALVLKAVVMEAYGAPVIVVIGDRGLHYVVDGHHRVLVHAWLRRRVQGYTLLVPGYKPRTAKSLLEIDVVNPVDTPVNLYCWRHVVNTIRFLEKHHKVLARVWLESIPVSMLKPTQPSTFESQLQKTSRSPVEECPVLVYKFGGEYYVIDGHHRVCKSITQGLSTVNSIVFSLDGLEIGLVKTSRKLRFSAFTPEYCTNQPLS